MNSETLKQFWDCFYALPEQVQIAAREAFETWVRDPRHVGLQFKRVHPSKPLYSVRVGRSWRALGYRREDTMVWFWIGTHAEYERMIRRY